MPRRWLLPLVALSLLALAATCGDGDGLNGVGLGSGIQGTVTIGPMCPVVTEESPCPDEPYQAGIVILDEDGDEVVSFQYGEDGTFTVNLSPGSYTIVPQSPNEGAPPFAAEQEVEVRRDEYTQVAVQYDSGIR